MTTVYFMRHSECLKVKNGMNSDNLQLCNEKQILSVAGEELAKKIAFKDCFVGIDGIYSSNYVRAIATAKYIADINGLDVNVVSDFGERKFGVNVWNELPDDFEKRQFYDENYKIGDGESLNEVQERMHKALIQVLELNKRKKVCIISHATAMTTLFKIWCDVIPSDGYYFNGKFISDTNWNYCELFKLEFDDDNSLINISNL